MPTPLQPEINPNRGYRQWLIGQIWTGPGGAGSFVPNVDDSIVDWDAGSLLRVSSVNSQGYSTLVPASLGNTGGYTGEDFTRSSGPVQTSDAYRLFINTSTVPFVLAIDSRLFCVHPDASYYKVFRGSNIGQGGNVVSAVYDGTGAVLSENVPLDEIGSLGTDDYRKVYRVANSVEPMATGEVATVVVYAATGTPLSRFGLYVENTDFIRTTGLNRKLVTGIEVVTPFLSNTDNTLIEYPVNMTVQSGMFRGRVHYSDGSSTLPLPIDGTRFSFFGLNTFLATVPGQTTRGRLNYRLAQDEYTNAVSGSALERSVGRSYRLRTVEAEGIYSIKLYVVPKAVTGATNAYTLAFYLYNMSRDTVLDVTEKVQFTSGSPAFNGTLYDVEQSVQVTLNLRDVLPSLPYYIHSQLFAITLRGAAGSMYESNYVNVDYGDGHVYGVGMSARYSSGTLYIDNGYLDVVEWIRALYENLDPLRYMLVEPDYVTPTHVRLRIDDDFFRVIPIAEAIGAILNVPLSNPQGRTLRLEFIKRDGASDKELGMGFLIVKNV
jgi:hypothetical protein